MYVCIRSSALASGKGEVSLRQAIRQTVYGDYIDKPYKVTVQGALQYKGNSTHGRTNTRAAYNT